MTNHSSLRGDFAEDIGLCAVLEQMLTAWRSIVVFFVSWGQSVPAKGSVWVQMMEGCVCGCMLSLFVQVACLVV